MSEDQDERDEGLEEEAFGDDSLDEDEPGTDDVDEDDHDAAVDKELGESLPELDQPDEAASSTPPDRDEPASQDAGAVKDAVPNVPATEAGETKEAVVKPDFEIEEGDILDEIKPPAKDQGKEAGGQKDGFVMPNFEIEEGDILDEIKPPAKDQDKEAGGQMDGFVTPAMEIEEGEILDEIRPSIKDKKKSADDIKNEFTRNQIEAVLFVSGQPVSAEEIAVKLSIPKKSCEDLLDKLALQYIERSSALEIAKIGDKYILQLKPEYTSSVKSFASGGLIREAVMRTLTVIAAKQPILQSDLSKIRSAAGDHLKELLEMGLVKATPKGRSRELVTTDKFADMFGFSREVAKMKEQIKVYLTAATSDDNE